MKPGRLRTTLLPTAIYAAAAALWITFSDWLLAALVGDARSLALLQTLKGLAFVGITAPLLYWVLTRTWRARSAAEAARSDQHVRLLNRVISASSASLRAEDVLSIACCEMSEAFGLPQSAALRDEDGEAFTVVAEYGAITGHSALGTRLPVEGNPSLQWVIEHGRPMAVSDARHDERLGPVRDVMVERGVASLLITPLTMRGEVIGTLGLDSPTPREFTAEEIELAAAVGRAVSQALTNAHLYEALQQANAQLSRAVAERTAELVSVKERVEAILDNSPDAILLINADGTIDTANRAFHNLCGHEDGGPHTLTGAVSEADEAALRTALEKVTARNRVMRLELTALRGDGQPFDGGLALAPFVEGATTRVVASLRDISALKEVERMKDRFVSNVSHELRTPIASLKLHHRLLDLNPAKHDTYMEHMSREIERLETIIEGLLVLSRLDRDAVEITPQALDLDALAAETVADRQVLADARELALHYTPPDSPLPLTNADPRLLGQVVAILLTNALAYTPAGGTVRVSAGTRSANGSAWVGFTVADTGPGIPEDEQPHLFDRFFRGRAARDSGVAGTGLGLSIAQEVVERHGGRIEVTSSGTPGEGAAFSVWLPAVQSAGSALEPKPGQHPDEGAAPAEF